MSLLTFVLFCVFIAGFAYVLLMGYGELLRVALCLLRLSRYLDKMNLPPQARTEQADSMAPVTVILPCCQKVRNPVEYVQHHLRLDYPQYELVAVCDGPRNSTLQKLQQGFSLVKVEQPIKRSVPTGAVRGVYRSPQYPNLTVVDKAPAGQADDLNCGVNVSRYPLLATASPGRWLQSQSLWPLARPLMMQYDVLAVGGLPRLPGSARGVLAQMQQTFLLKECPAGIAVPGQKRLPLVAGGYGAFRKTAVVGAGGFAGNTAELDMAVRLFAGQKKNSGSVQMLPRAGWQMVPWRGLRGLWQGCRDMQREMQGALWNCKRMLFRPKYGRTGMWEVPLHIFLDVLGPILEALAIVLSVVLYFTGTISFSLLLGFWVVEILFGVVNCLAAVLSQQVADGERFTMPRLVKNIGCAILYPFGFRQLVAVLRAVAVFAPKN